MATYVALFSWTGQGVRNAKATVKRAEKFAKAIRKTGGRLKDIYWTMGRYDGVLVLEAPNDETATSIMVGVCSLGNIKTETMRAFDAAAMGKILAKA